MWMDKPAWVISQDYLFPSALDAPSRNTAKNSNMPRGHLYRDVTRGF